jgi:hypothetical protein
MSTTTTKTTGTRERRAPIAPGRSGLSSTGVRQARATVGCDIVTVPEAAARLGCESATLLSLLSRQKSRALIVGYGGWLVDLQALIIDSELEVPVSGVSTVESGESL